ncbi:MAG: glycerophosphodiester phosphodiesterase family protein [Chitinophagaceae bacterium]
MKTILCSVLLVLSACCFAQQSHLLQFKTTEELRSFLSYSEKRIPLISAHRGGPEKGYPENAVETFQHSIGFQPLVIECDIALSKDSALVMMHDDRLDRTTTGTGAIQDYTLAELKKLQLKDNDGNLTDFRIPTLDEVLQWGKGKVIFTLDVKRGVPFEKVIAAVRRNKAESCSVIITYNANQAAEVHKLADDLMISASIRGKEDLERLNSYGVPDNRLIAFVGITEPDPSVYQLLHEHKIQCILGTMGNLDKQAIARGDKVYYDFVSRGADVLSSDRPKEAGQALKQYISDNKLSSPHIRTVK